MTHQDLAKAMAAVVKDYVRADRAALETRIAVLETKQAVPLPEIAPDDIAASVAGLLRKELADLDAAMPAKTTRRRIEKDATGYTITEEPVGT